MEAPSNRRVRFGQFEFDPDSRVLLRDGWPVKIQPQPLRVLAVLLERPGQVVSREELRRQVWDQSTFVEFDEGLNYSVRQIRLALSDKAAKPTYIETLPKQGYRFIAHVERTGSEPGPDLMVATEPEVPNAAVPAIPVPEHTL